MQHERQSKSSECRNPQAQSGQKPGPVQKLDHAELDRVSGGYCFFIGLGCGFNQWCMWRNGC